jgi:hypothetical protein
MSQIGLLICSRNNYDLIESWRNNYDYADQVILNIDDGSSLVNLRLGQKICKKNKIFFIKSKKKGLQNNIYEACQFFEKKKIKWILYQHHDSYPLTKNIFSKLGHYISNGKIKKFGVIGFNVLDSINGDLQYWNNNKTPLRTTARSVLELGDGWYRKRIGSRIHYKKTTKAFAVESVMWSTALINTEMFKKKIKIDNNFNFFHAWDDIAFQFLNQNIYNIVLPNIHFAHDQKLKIDHKIPYSSANASNKKRKYYYGHFNHLKIWNNKWGFEYDLTKNISFHYKKFPILYRFLRYLGINRWSFLETRARVTFKKNLNKYKKTLLFDFFNHDPKNSYLKEFNL